MDVGKQPGQVWPFMFVCADLYVFFFLSYRVIVVTRLSDLLSMIYAIHSYHVVFIISSDEGSSMITGFKILR